MKAITPGQELEFIPKADRGLPEAEQTVFLVKFPDAQAMAKLRDEMYHEKGTGKQRLVAMRTGTFEYDTLKKGLVGWRNFVGEDGEQVEFAPGRLAEMINCIPPDVRTEVALFVRGEKEEEEE